MTFNNRGWKRPYIMTVTNHNDQCPNEVTYRR